MRQTSSLSLMRTLGQTASERRDRRQTRCRDQASHRSLELAPQLPPASLWPEGIQPRHPLAAADRRQLPLTMSFNRRSGTLRRQAATSKRHHWRLRASVSTSRPGQCSLCPGCLRRLRRRGAGRPRPQEPVRLFRRTALYRRPPRARWRMRAKDLVKTSKVSFSVARRSWFSRE